MDPRQYHVTSVGLGHLKYNFLHQKFYLPKNIHKPNPFKIYLYKQTSFKIVQISAAQKLNYKPVILIIFNKLN